MLDWMINNEKKVNKIPIQTVRNIIISSTLFVRLGDKMKKSKIEPSIIIRFEPNQCTI